MKIDTSTTEGKIAVMQAYNDGRAIQYKTGCTNWEGCTFGVPSWEWGYADYRIKPETVEEAAKIYDPRLEDFSTFENAFKAGAEWQKEQDNES